MKTINQEKFQQCIKEKLIQQEGLNEFTFEDYTLIGLDFKKIDSGVFTFKNCTFKKNSIQKEGKTDDKNKQSSIKNIYISDLINNRSSKERTIHKNTSLNLFRNSYESIRNVKDTFNIGKINMNPHINNHQKIKSITFNKCEFEELFIFEDQKLNYLKIEDCNFKKVLFKNITSEENFIFTKNKNIENITFDNCDFQKFEFKENVVNENFEIDDCNFHKLADFHGSTFEKKFEVHKTRFERLVILDNVKFHGFSEFKYVTFTYQAIFREAKIYGDLDISQANFETHPSFFNAHIEDKNTNRETLRIIKDSFLAKNNKIEAAKFHSLELRRYREELKEEGENYQERILLAINDLTSSFSQSWVKPLGWILLVGVVSAFFGFVIGIDEWDCLNQGTTFWGAALKYVYPLASLKDFDLDKDNDKLWKYALLLFNKATLGYLYYQFLTATRRFTKF